MKKIFNVAIVALLFGAMAVSCCNSGKKTLLTKGNSSKMDTLSYAMGANLGEFVSTRIADIPFNFEELDRGLESAALGKSKWTPEQAQEVFQSLIMPVNDRFGQSGPANELLDLYGMRGKDIAELAIKAIAKK